MLIVQRWAAFEVRVTTLWYPWHSRGELQSPSQTSVQQASFTAALQTCSAHSNPQHPCQAAYYGMNTQYIPLKHSLTPTSPGKSPGASPHPKSSATAAACAASTISSPSSTPRSNAKSPPNPPQHHNHNPPSPRHKPPRTGKPHPPSFPPQPKASVSSPPQPTRSKRVGDTAGALDKARHYQGSRKRC